MNHPSWSSNCNMFSLGYICQNSEKKSLQRRLLQAASLGIFHVTLHYGNFPEVSPCLLSCWNSLQSSGKSCCLSFDIASRDGSTLIDTSNWLLFLAPRFLGSDLFVLFILIPDLHLAAFLCHNQDVWPKYIEIWIRLSTFADLPDSIFKFKEHRVGQVCYKERQTLLYYLVLRINVFCLLET